MTAQAISTPLSSEDFKTHVVSTPEAEIFFVEAGDSKNPTVLFLHGFPDDHTVWEQQLVALKDDFHVAALDIRGVGNSELKAPKLGAYRVERLALDIESVINALVGKRGKVHLVAHDWGSITAWSAISEGGLQQRVSSFTSISGPHMSMSVNWIKESLLSLEPKKVWQALKQVGVLAHFGLFNLPFIQYSVKAFPKQWARLSSKLGGMASAEALFGASCVNDEVISRRFFLPIELYRQNWFPLPKLPAFNSVKTPIQLIAPQNDPFISEELLAGVEPFAGNIRKELVAGNHWAMKTNSDKVNALISGFVKEQDRSQRKRRSVVKARVDEPSVAAPLKKENVDKSSTAGASKKKVVKKTQANRVSVSKASRTKVASVKKGSAKKAAPQKTVKKAGPVKKKKLVKKPSAEVES